MNDKTIDLDGFLAAIIDQFDGEIVLGREYIEKDRSGLVIAIDVDPLRDAIVFSLMKEEEVEYDDQ